MALPWDKWQNKINFKIKQKTAGHYTVCRMFLMFLCFVGFKVVRQTVKGGAPASREELGRMWTWTLSAVFPVTEIKCWGWRFGLDFGLVSAQSVPSSSSSERLRTTLWQSISLFNLLKGATLFWNFEINQTVAKKTRLGCLVQKKKKQCKRCSHPFSGRSKHF